MAHRPGLARRPPRHRLTMSPRKVTTMMTRTLRTLWTQLTGVSDVEHLYWADRITAMHNVAGGGTRATRTPALPHRGQGRRLDLTTPTGNQDPASASAVPGLH